jgi:uncharacterized membrane protein
MAIALMVTTLAAAVAAYVGFLGLAGKLPPNNVAGIRTPFTRQSAGNWYATHQAGSPYLVLPAVAALAAGLAFVPFAFASKVPDGVITVIVVVQGVLVVAGALLAWRIGTSHAKAKLADSGPSG